MSETRQTYCIVSPVRDEEKYMRRTLDSVVNQTVPPDLWVIVDDGSTDATPQILAEYAARYPFIQVIQRQNRGMRRVGGGVVEAFYEGWAVAEPYHHDFLTKLDMDQPYPGADAEGQRGRAGTPKQPTLPYGWLDSRELNEAHRAEVAEAEVHNSGG